MVIVVKRKLSAIKEHLAGGLWALAWMWPLIATAIAIGEGRVRPVWPAAVGLSVFVVLYLIVVVNAFDDKRPTATLVDIGLLVTLGIVGVGLLFGYGGDGAGWLNLMLYIAVCGAATLEPKHAAGWTIGAALVLILWAATPGHGSEPNEGADVAQTVFSMLLASALVFSVKQLVRYNRLLRSTRAELARTAVSEERLRFARDLHDLLGHTLSLIVVKAEVVRRLTERDPAAAAGAAADIETIGRQALAEVRDAVSGYREPRFETEIDGVRAALTDAGIAVRFQQVGGRLEESTSRLFGWTVREAATNVIRHSRARTCTITVTTASTGTTMTVCDDGVGAQADGLDGSGLLGLRERVAAAGGSVATTTRDGFQVVVTVPTAMAPVTT